MAGSYKHTSVSIITVKKVNSTGPGMLFTKSLTKFIKIVTKVKKALPTKGSMF
jgi:hypothetical protein